jgi:hypothetical protein
LETVTASSITNIVIGLVVPAFIATVRVWVDGGQAWRRGNWLTAL